MTQTMLLTPSTTRRCVWTCPSAALLECTLSPLQMTRVVTLTPVGCPRQLKPIVGQYARVVFDVIGADGFGQECSLLTEKGA